MRQVDALQGLRQTSRTRRADSHGWPPAVHTYMLVPIPTKKWTEGLIITLPRIKFFQVFHTLIKAGRRIDLSPKWLWDARDCAHHPSKAPMQPSPLKQECLAQHKLGRETRVLGAASGALLAEECATLAC